MGRPVVHFEVSVKDGEAGRKFYSELFDWKIDFNNPMHYGLVSTEGKEGIGGGIFEAKDGAPTYVTFYVQVDDLQSYLSKAEGLGGKTMMPPTQIQDMGSIALFTDPEGNIIGLFQNAPES
ncbi:MAG: VOC family protein [Blastocatellia bacterium AA13]|nr:MAG: VOC family protein [Blastocatellia bacterium AA13]